GFGAVALPQLPAVGAVLGAEEQRAVHVYQVARRGVGGAREDVLDADGAGFGAVALPELISAGAVAGLEEQGPVDVPPVPDGKRADNQRGGRAGVDVP